MFADRLVKFARQLTGTKVKGKSNKYSPQGDRA
jgi:hypothetical protein